MINTLHIKNVGIIDELSIDLNSGFNVLTGETGAGKTLIIDSLEILSGGRFSKEIIRTGTEYSYVEMSILGEKEDIIISREINKNGKNLCKINGRMVTVNELKEYMRNFIDIHGQHENQTLLDTNKHIEYLDGFSKIELAKYKEEYSELYQEYKKLEEELKKNYGDDKEKQRKLDLLRYQLNEIEIAKLKEGEEEELEEKRKIILNSEKISENLNITDLQISEKALDSISMAVKGMEKIENLDKKYENILERIREIYYNTQELSRDISALREETYFDEEDRQKIEQRLDIIYELKRKYGNNEKEIIKYCEEIKTEIFEIENLDEFINDLKTKLSNLESKMKYIAQQMNNVRKNYAAELDKVINIQLKDLEMKNAKFLTKVEYSDNSKFNENGLNNVEFLISTNIGEEYKPLVKIASGGEMSRIMLAIKSVLADVDKKDVLVFDEIDTGISGIAAKSVAEKIKNISKKHQVICVTHLAPIAAVANNHYYISKNVINNETKTSIRILNEQESINEIARIASGEITEISLKHAEELKKRS